MSAGAETSVLARRGLAFAARSRRAARSPWFASFAFPRPRASMDFGAPAEPLPEEAVSFSEEAPSAAEDVLPDEGNRGQSPISVLRMQEPMRTPQPYRIALPSLSVEEGPAHRAAEESTQESTTEMTEETREEKTRAKVEEKTQAKAEEKMQAKTQAKTEEKTQTKKQAKTEETTQVPPLARAGPRLAQDVLHPASGQEAAAGQEATQRETAPLRNVAQRPAAPSFPRIQPRAEALTGNVPTAQAHAAAPSIGAHAAARVSMPMGRPAQTPRREPTAHAAVAAASARYQALERAARAASASVGARIGTVQIVVRTPPPAPQPMPPAPAVPLREASAQAPAQRPFRNPWTSSRWRRGD